MNTTPEEESKQAETAKHIINMQQKIQKNTEEIQRLDKKIDDIKREGVEERRKLENKLKRSLWEVLQIALGNKEKVEKLSHRTEDSEERLDKVENTIDWVMRTLIGLFITTVFSAIIMYVVGKF